MLGGHSILLTAQGLSRGCASLVLPVEFGGATALLNESLRDSLQLGHRFIPEIRGVVCLLREIRDLLRERFPIDGDGGVRGYHLLLQRSARRVRGGQSHLSLSL